MIFIKINIEYLFTIKNIFHFIRNYYLSHINYIIYNYFKNEN